MFEENILEDVQQEKIIFENDKYSIISIDKKVDNNIISNIKIKLYNFEKPIYIGEIKNKIGEKNEWIEYNDYAIALVEKESVLLKKRTAKIIFFIPSLSFISGDEFSLKNMYKILFGINKIEENPKVKKYCL